MEIWKGLTLVTAGVLVLAAQGSAAGSATTSVYAVDRRRMSLASAPGSFSRKGSVTATARAVLCAHISTLCVSPDGNPSGDAAPTGFGGFVLPGAPAFGLVGRVGGGPWVQVGSGPTTLSG